MDMQSMNYMKNLWRRYDLPDEPDFSHWSKEYAREVYEVITQLAESREVLLELLFTMDVWEEDKALQQWAPSVDYLNGRS